MESEKERNQKHRGSERTDADRQADRERKQRSRDRQYAVRDAERVQSMDQTERRIQEIMAQIAEEPRKPRPATVRIGPPEPAKLPSLVEWHNFLKSIPESEAIRKELSRLETAIAAGLVEFPRRSEEGNYGAI